MVASFLWYQGSYILYKKILVVHGAQTKKQSYIFSSVQSYWNIKTTAPSTIMYTLHLADIYLAHLDDMKSTVEKNLCILLTFLDHIQKAV